MGMATWACFDCRQAVRRPAWTDGEVPCARCGRPARSLGMKIRVPPKAAVREWARLRAQLNRSRLAQEKAAQVRLVQHRHELEHQLAELQSRPESPGRARLLRRLEEEIRALKPGAHSGL